jgi:hypothetical protein
MAKPLLIAEVKTDSPFGYQAEQSWDELFALADHYGDWLSVHTNPLWGGSFDLLEKARRLTSKPILAKGLHETNAELQRALDCGADYVLAVRSQPPGILGDKVLYEPTTLDELKLASGAVEKAVWNARQLAGDAGQPKTVDFAEARAAFSGWLCQASFVRTIDDIHPLADAVLVGEHLQKFITTLC